MSEPFIKHNDSILHIEKWQKRNEKLKVGFTTKHGGVSRQPYASLNGGLHVNDSTENVIRNREIIANHVRIPLNNWVSGEQIHQTRIHAVTENDKGKGATEYDTAIKDTDGLITNTSGILCTGFFADCVPLFFFDPITSYIGIAHAGWKGTVSGIADDMVNTLANHGVNVSDLLVAIGPCITKQFYEVEQKVIDRIPLSHRQSSVLPTGINRYLLDLKQLNIDILLQAGVLRNNIDVTNYCTFRENDLFFSHRRDHGRTGRMLGFIGFSS
ncbi:peptidoglycan editing factor PgeF [Agaribacter marinus]|uniref:Purine nucleoside phosphorylase n=1 Tax=Virgibacillus salarius TaxID=447199 RepID=A0A941DT95_9BACI|nr:MULTISPECIES: peptidoglycan editing factor PgeF [Bacillaceae]MBR7795321.1 peptidoglycan editing factor PgeF [Virgibacillus salarius]NAZ08036.1 peptidoglycan editing factor PgeF [Agaribacter marinus]WBX79644.1 peptidoglycan editing factor PgeF [Virgibacillus salarius]